MLIINLLPYLFCTKFDEDSLNMPVFEDEEAPMAVSSLFSPIFEDEEAHSELIQGA